MCYVIPWICQNASNIQNTHVRTKGCSGSGSNREVHFTKAICVFVTISNTHKGIGESLSPHFDLVQEVLALFFTSCCSSVRSKDEIDYSC